MMRKPLLFMTASAMLAMGHAQTASGPGKPEENGVTPVTETYYVNTPETINNGKTESLGVAITSNSNVVLGWEDDGNDLTDLEAVWTLYSRSGVALTPDTEITSLGGGAPITSKFLSYFRKDKTAVSGATSWGPKIKANPFGAGFGMGGTSFGLGAEVVEFADIQNDAGGGGDFPSVQILDNTGAPVIIASGVADADAEAAGDIRIGDWDFLGNGNIVIVGESRQRDELMSKYNGAATGNHAIYRVVNATGAEVKAVSIVSATPDVTEIWHGVGVTKDGFAVRFSLGGRATVRMFDNAGAPKTGNIDLATLTGKPIPAAGGRGDSVGFHGNGNDAYVSVAAGTDEDGIKKVWVTVLNADGTVRYSKSVSDDLALNNPGRVDAGIDSAGRVVVVYADNAATGGAAAIIHGRLFDPTGKPLGGTFYVSEKELPDPATLEARNPRVAFRNDLIAVTWESVNSGLTDARVVAARHFALPFQAGTIESVGITRIVPDTVVINPGANSLGNWEPYVSVLGTSTFLIEGNTFADGLTDAQRYVVAFQPAAGGAMKLGEAIFSDAGTPYKGKINESRQNGNPGRVAGDPRPGAVNFITGVEASPHAYDQFKSDNRWDLGFDRLGDGRYGVIQTFKLDPTTLQQTALSKAQDAATGRQTTGAAPGSQISRFGGDVVGLDNGNFVAVVEDRSLVFNEGGNAAVAVIVAPDGTIVKNSFKVANGDLWSNVAAFKGGFAVRVAGVIYFYDNAGNLTGQVDQNASGESFSRGRGDGERLGGHVNAPYVYLVGKVTTAKVVKVVAFDASTASFVASAEVSESGFSGDFDRANVGVDALNRVTVAWVCQPEGYGKQQVAARVLQLEPATKSFKALTKSFLAFLNTAKEGDIRSVGMSVAMTTKQILIAAKGEINLQNQPSSGANSPTEINFYTVLSHPDPKEDPRTAGGSELRISGVTQSGSNLTITWAGGTGPFKIQKRASLTSGAWADVGTSNGTSFTTTRDGSSGFFRVVGN